MAGTVENWKADILELANDITTHVRDIVTSIGFIYHHNITFSDAEILQTLKDQYNIPTTLRQVAEIRRRSG
jgi:hypothetical protein